MDRESRERAAVAAAGLRISDKHAMSRAGLAPMSLAGDCQGQPASTIRPGIVPMCLTCGAFNGGDKLGTLKPAAVRLPPGMEWGCVNWRGLDSAGTHSPGASVTPDATFFRALGNAAGLTPDQVQACDEMAGLCGKHGRECALPDGGEKALPRGGEVSGSGHTGGVMCGGEQKGEA